MAVLAAWVFGVWGVLAAGRGVYDLIWGLPEANLYAPSPWGFISREEWRRYGVFELVYGLACAGLAGYLVRFSRFLPDTVARSVRES
ncbi:MAG: hypothetical protein ABIJ96_11850 [Elusimicrobiota bacterium]